MSNPKNPMLLTVKEVALLLRIHRPKVYDLIRDGTIQGFKLGSDWRVKRDSVEKLVGAIPDDFFNKRGSAGAAAERGEREQGLRVPS
jgi:excisionase family DNA binding protein